MLLNIQTLRFIAAFAVVLFHTAPHYYEVGGGTNGNLFSFFEKFGYAGVDVFFVISGFIIWVSTKQYHGIMGMIDFAYRRATRIYLGYWPFYLIMAALLYLESPTQFKEINWIGSFFLTLPLSEQLLLKISWTLRYELYFYLCFLLLIAFPRKKIIFVLGFAFAIIICLQLWAIFIGRIYQEINFPSASSIYTFYFSPYCLEFITGCFIGYFFENRRINRLIFCFFGALLFGWSAIWYQDNWISGMLAQGYYMPQRVFLFGTASALLLSGLVEMEKRGKILMPKFGSVLGGASYSIYLSHTIILVAIYYLGLRTAIKEHAGEKMIWMVLIVALILMYSVGHYLLIEKPLMAFARNAWIRLRIRREDQ